MTELEAVTERLAAGDLGIEAAADLYERAERLHALATERLAQVQARVEALGRVGGPGGRPRVRLGRAEDAGRITGGSRDLRPLQGPAAVGQASRAPPAPDAAQHPTGSPGPGHGGGRGHPVHDLTNAPLVD